MTARGSSIHFFVIAALLVGLSGCQPKATVTVPPDTPIPVEPTVAPDVEEQTAIEEEPWPVLLSERDHHPYNWLPEDVKGLDPWGDAGSDATDLIAVYQRQNGDVLEFRVDIMNFQEEAPAPVYFAIDYQDGGNAQIDPGKAAPSFDLEWDLLVSVVHGKFSLYDPAFADISDQFVGTEVNRQLDYLFFSVPVSVLEGWSGEAFQMQALLLDPAGTRELDRTTPVTTDNTTGRAKLVLTPSTLFWATTPSSAADNYDGFYKTPMGGRPDERPGERRGSRYLLDAVERYKVPITIIDFHIEEIPGFEYLRINERFRHLASKGLLDALATLGYGHFMPWQPDDVDAKAIEIAKEIRTGLDLPLSPVFYPYEGMLTPGDIQTIKDAGFEAIMGWDRGRSSFFGYIDDFYADQASHKEEVEYLRKIHQFNGMKFFFHTEIENYDGAAWDERWGGDYWSMYDWDEYSDEYKRYGGTDQGLFISWRRILHDMAMDSDQEQYYTIGTDLLLTPWQFQDVVEWNFQWLASHPWIEATTFRSLLDRGWEVIDHGNLGLAQDELLERYAHSTDWAHYNDYFPEYYYGGISDGRSTYVPAGVEIEGYYDYVPFLRDGQLIPSGRIMGDDKTSGSIIYETVGNLRSAPDNPLTTLAWLAYLVDIGEQTFHDGAHLRESEKIQANLVGQVNKIVAAANWAEAAEQGSLSGETQVFEEDLDLDGESEYVMHNDRVYAVFENDGGRLEYAFAYDPDFGPVELIAPANQYWLKPGPEYDFQNGEVAIPLTWASWQWSPDGAFVDDLDQDGVFEYEPLSGSVVGSSLVFTRETQPVVKTFTLEGDTIHAHYEGLAGTFNIAFANSVNRLGVYDRDWVKNFEVIELPDTIGWQMKSGGAVLLDIENTRDYRTASFSDSPAREERQQREDLSSYTEGHDMYFPCSWIKIWDTKKADYALTLRAAPVDANSYLQAATPGPALSPEQEVSTFIYDDSAARGWEINAWDGEIDLRSGQVVFAGQYAIKADLDPWGAFGAWTEPVDTSQFLHLEFHLNGGSQGGQQINVLTFDDDTVLANLAVGEYTQNAYLPAGEWMTVRIPVADLNPDDSPMNGIVIENHSDDPAATFYVDDLGFVAARP